MFLHVPEPELVEVTPGEVVQVVDAVLLTPRDDMLRPVVMPLYRRFGTVGRLVVEI